MLATLCVTQVFAQSRTITGTVTAKEDGLPLPGVTVKIKGTDQGVSTDANGKFSISAQTGTTLTFSYIAYLSQDVTVGADNVINVVLVENTQQLSEVVVTAIGISREAKSLGYSTTTVRSEDLTRARETNVLNSLAGQVAGVRVNQQSGSLGGSTKVIIRGVNSLGAQNTLYVIDGLTVSDAAATGGTTAFNIDYGNRMGDLSADDIETMTVLKGAAATALYGSRAKDGAVIITTKRGKAGKMSIDINSSYRFENPLILPKFQNEYAQGNFGVYALTQVNGWGPRIADVQNQKFPNFLSTSNPATNVTLQAYPDNVKNFFQTGTSAINNIAISGGDENSDYRISFSGANSTGMIPKSTLDKYTISLNAGRQFSKRLSSRFTMAYTSIKGNGIPSQGSNNTNNIVPIIYGLPRTVDINLLRDNSEDPVTGTQIYLSPTRTGNNPYWVTNYNQNSNTVDRFVGTYVLTYKPVEWVTINNNLGMDIYTEKRFQRIRKGTASFVDGRFIDYTLLNKQLNDDLTATFQQDNLVKDFKFKLILGGNINQRFSQATNVDASNLTIDQLYNYTNAASKVPTLEYSKRRLLGLYGDLTISYKDFLYLEATGRNDWTSTLPTNNRSYFYPSVSGTFIFTEIMDKKPSWLSFGKLRASWASVGSDLAPYQLDYQYTPVSTVFLQYVSANAIVFPAGPISTAFTAPRTLPNANLVPQKANSTEIGAELRFLDNRIGLDFTYYNTIIRNQLIAVDVAVSSGYSTKFVNIGAIRNRGIEVALNTVPVKTKDFSWNLNFNFAQNKQVVLELAPGLTSYNLASGYSGLQFKAEPGQPFGLYGSKWQRAPDGQIVVNATSGQKVAVTGQRLGNVFADWTGGIKNTFNYKGLVLSALVDIRKGGLFYSGTVAGLRSSGLGIETAANNRAPIVTPGVNLVAGNYVPNTTAMSAQNYWAWEGSVTNTEANTFDAGFVKLREVQLAYSLPKSIFKASSFIKGIQVGVEGRNLWLIRSAVPHVDPELNFFGAGSVGEGVEFNSIPSARSFGMNLRLSL